MRNDISASALATLMFNVGLVVFCLICWKYVFFIIITIIISIIIIIIIILCMCIFLLYNFEKAIPFYIRLTMITFYFVSKAVFIQQ